MKHFVLFTDSGRIVGHGASDSPVAPDGLGLLELQQPFTGSTRDFAVVNGALVNIDNQYGQYGVWNGSYCVLDIEHLEAEARVQRSALLSASDWTQLPDVSLINKVAWAIYRQALRDITDQPGYPLDITWPTPPGAQ